MNKHICRGKNRGPTRCSDLSLEIAELGAYPTDPSPFFWDLLGAEDSFSFFSPTPQTPRTWSYIPKVLELLSEEATPQLAELEVGGLKAKLTGGLPRTIFGPAMGLLRGSESIDLTVFLPGLSH